MAFKFLSIVKANARITELETENESLKSENKALTDAHAENSAALLKDAESTAAKLAETSAALEKAQADMAARLAARDAEVKDLTEKLAAKSAEVDAIAARKALEITAAQGQPPVQATPTSNPAQQPDKPQLKGLDRTRAAFQAQAEALLKSTK